MPDPSRPPDSPKSPGYVIIQVGEIDAIRSTISFLASVIRSGEPYTEHVQQAVANAFERTSRWIRNNNPLDSPHA